jgi:cellulose synthase/poly-beta-1,6-N-acetylglucosamine synthase-like glycosyltransferase
MKTKLVYVLVSYDEQNDYLEQCLLSCYSARLHNADAEIILLVDNLTDNTLQGKRAEILKYISQKIVIDIAGNYNATQRSRIIKTTAREYVRGDFLFIDTDTVITQSIAGADQLQCSIGAVADGHVPTKKNIAAWKYLKKIDRLFIKTVKADVYIHKFFKQYKFDGQHYWEIGTREHTKRSVLKSMRKFFAVEKWYVAPFNPYHVFFILRKKV